MTRKPTLRTDAQLPERLVLGPPGALRDVLRAFADARHHLRLVLELGKLGGDDAEDGLFVGRQVLEGGEGAGARGVVFEVERVHVEFAEEGLRDDVVASFGEVTGIDKVPAADMQTDVQVLGRCRDARVVEIDIGVEEVVGGVDVGGIGFPAVEELGAAEVWYRWG